MKTQQVTWTWRCVESETSSLIQFRKKRLKEQILPCRRTPNTTNIFIFKVQQAESQSHQLQQPILWQHFSYRKSAALSRTHQFSGTPEDPVWLVKEGGAVLTGPVLFPHSFLLTHRSDFSPDYYLNKAVICWLFLLKAGFYKHKLRNVQKLQTGAEDRSRVWKFCCVKDTNWPLFSLLSVCQTLRQSL